MKAFKRYFSEIYYPTPLTYKSTAPIVDTPIHNIIKQYPPYMSLIDLWADGRPYLYDNAYPIKAKDFLANVQFKLLEKKKEQEEVNHAYLRQQAQAQQRK